MKMSQQNTNPDPAEPKEIVGQNPDNFIPNQISEQEAKDGGFIPATDINAFAKLVVDWQINICNQGTHVLNLVNQPEDPQMIRIWVYEPDHPEANEKGLRPLTEAEVLPFKHGVRYLLDMVEQLPFQYTPSDADGNTLPGFGMDSTENGQNDEDKQEEKPTT